ncbi:hypothetical protein N802_15660 [Knoellia sinensis KCTC 19936]|uniref:Uncharacterized protein n=1 Tax=Knoellia sinensis KCTC 19936 TaxID=1385520 RepID=A0A0A0J7S7_9MICO|nr:hypothetical protein [Knoellia sinensis]KGN32829.1 hypothetical protein N802_15660 [Knoellia sinensis KCTC 19936]
MSTAGSRTGRAWPLLIGGGALFFGLALMVAGVFGGFVPIPGVTTGPARPPCTSLPSATEVEAALSEHADVTRSLQRAVPGARVTVVKPCDGAEAGRGMASISVPDGDAAEDVSHWLGTNDGYGVPVEVTTR